MLGKDFGFVVLFFAKDKFEVIVEVTDVEIIAAIRASEFRELFFMAHLSNSFNNDFFCFSNIQSARNRPAQGVRSTVGLPLVR